MGIRKALNKKRATEGKGKMPEGRYITDNSAPRQNTKENWHHLELIEKNESMVTLRSGIASKTIVPRRAYDLHMKNYG